MAESFFSNLKKERVRGGVYGNREEAHSDVFDYIEVFYNRQRRHGHLGGLAPMMFEAVNSKKQQLTVYESGGVPRGFFSVSQTVRLDRRRTVRSTLSIGLLWIEHPAHKQSPRVFFREPMFVGAKYIAFDGGLV